VRVLVTGATTSIGAVLVRRLLADPSVEHVLACGREDAPPPGLLPVSPRLSYREVDLTRPRAAHDLLWGAARGFGSQALIHMALHRSAQERGERVHALNVEATRELLSMAERHPTISRFILRSSGEVYAIRATVPTLIDEDQPLEFDPAAPQFVRDRVEADLTVCARMGMSDLQVIVLRCAEVLAAGTGSQLWDYMRSRVCFRPLGFDPMINLLSLEDAACAIQRALVGQHHGVHNVPGADTLPLSRIIARWGRLDVPVPGPLLTPLYRMRTRALGLEFRYDLNVRRFHFGGVLDGTRTRIALGYEPCHPIDWPRPLASGPAAAGRGAQVASDLPAA
jgi:UDP-glucose 4-epimerase